MKIKQLIKELEKFDKELKVVTFAGAGVTADLDFFGELIVDNYEGKSEKVLFIGNKDFNY